MALYQVASVASLTIRSIGFVFGMELYFNMRVLSTSSSTLWFTVKITSPVRIKSKSQ
jgi:hypothetical protein